MVDEAFADCHPEVSLVSEAARPGLLVLRSFGKFFGLAGLRLGFAVAPRHTVEVLRALLGPWAVSGPAIEAGRIALSDADWIARNDTHLEWVRPDAGGMCCVRLRASAFDDAAVEGFYRLAAERTINMAAGDRFLDERRVFRLGFGALPRETLEQALEALEGVCRDAATA